MWDYTELGRMLHDEHIRTLSLMNALDTRITGRAAALRIDASIPRDRDLLTEVVAAVDEEVNQHFAFEEAVLFPVIADTGAIDMTTLLTREHASISLLGKRLQEIAAHALDSGLDDAGWTEFRQVAGELISRVTFHLQKEEMGLVQRLQAFFDAATDRRLADLYVRHRTGTGDAAAAPGGTEPNDVSE